MLTKTVSEVDVSPSTDILLKLSSTALFAKDASVSLSMAKSVNIKANIVAMFGNIIPDPFAKPEIVNILLKILNFFRVSLWF